MSRKRVIVVTVGIMLSLFMAAVESTVVATAMPTIVSELGGLAFYSWVFTAYMLTSTTTVPIYGKLSDILGRKPVFMVAMALFLVGSVLCGQSQTMGELIAFRALQGLGAGGLMPLAFIMIGDMFSFEQRAKMQGLFSGVWGVAAIIGPLLGGFLVDNVSWQWVFYVNLVPGVVATALIWFGWRDPERQARAARLPIDFAGTVLLSAGVVALLLGLTDLQKPLGVRLIGLAALLFVALLWVERRAADPILPLPLFKDRLFAVAVSQGLLAGWAMFGSTSYIPLFAQAVLGTSATAAGSVLTPMMLGWVGASIVGSRLLLRFGYRTIALAGMGTLVVGTFFMTRISPQTTLPILMVNVTLMGIGMGLSIPAFMIAVQSSVQRKVLGTATATLQFSRSIGGTLGVSVMGVILSMQLSANLRTGGRSGSRLLTGHPAPPGRQRGARRGREHYPARRAHRRAAKRLRRSIDCGRGRVGCHPVDPARERVPDYAGDRSGRGRITGGPIGDGFHPPGSPLPLHAARRDAIRPELAARAREDGMTHLALTDTNALYGAVAFARACRAAELQPVIGMTLAVRPTPQPPSLRGKGVTNSPPLAGEGLGEVEAVGETEETGQLVLLATGPAGYRSLCRLSSLIQGTRSARRWQRVASAGMSWPRTGRG